MKKRLLALLLGNGLAVQGLAADAGDKGVTILYTNDVHTDIDKDLTY